MKRGTVRQKKTYPLNQSKRAQPEPSMNQTKPLKPVQSTFIRATSLTGESSFEGSFSFLNEQLVNVDLWIVFLSHPDKDHINWLGTTFNKLPKKTKMLLIAGGRWLRTTPTEEIRDVLSLIHNSKNHDRILSFFPHEDGQLSCDEMEAWLQLNGKNITKKDPESFRPRNEYNGCRLDKFHGTLSSLFEVYKDKKKPLDFIGLSSDSALKQAITNSILNKIYIWSLDYPIGNTNAQSIVWSHDVDDIGWTFVYTGDAENSTFENIKNNLKVSTDVIRSKKRAPNSKPNLIMMQGMHHGSAENLSQVAMKLFCPNVIAFSAGNGASFAHPSTNAITGYEIKANFVSEFWARYSLTNLSYSFAAFEKRGDGSQGKATQQSIIENAPVFLCTNTYGTIKINDKGIFTPFNDTPGYSGYYDLHAYEWCGSLDQLSTSLERGSFTVSKLTLTNEDVYKTEDFSIALKDQELTKHTHTETKNYLLLSFKGNADYLLKAIQKVRKVSGKDTNFVYFYVLKKLVAPISN